MEAVAEVDSPTLSESDVFVWSEFFAFAYLKRILFRFALESIGIAIAIATIIIMLMTANWWVGVICFFTLTCILTTSLSLMIIVGWKIGLNEA